MPLFGRRREQRVSGANEKYLARRIVSPDELLPLINSALDIVLGLEFRSFDEAVVFTRFTGGKPFPDDPHEALAEWNRRDDAWSMTMEGIVKTIHDPLMNSRLADGDPRKDVCWGADLLLSQFLRQHTFEAGRSRAMFLHGDKRRTLEFKKQAEDSAAQVEILRCLLVDAMRELHANHPDLFDSIAISEANLHFLGLDDLRSNSK